MNVIRNIFLITISFLSLNFGCKETSPEPRDEVKSIRRDLSWSVDTLYHGQSGSITIYDMWKANDSILFAVGADQYDGSGAIWKYNGSTWERIKLHSYEGGTLTKAFSFRSINGFSENSIYAFGEHYYANPNPPPNFIHTAMAAHYNGIQWEEITIPNGDIMLHNDAYSPTDFYVGGTNGQLFHFSNGAWTVDTIGFSLFPNQPFYNVDVLSCSRNGVYLLSNQYNPSYGMVFYQTLLYSQDTTILLDSTNELTAKWGLNFYWKSNEGSIYSAGNNGIFKFAGTKWIKIFSTEGFLSLSGTSDNDIFAFGYSGNVYHYNGNDWKIVLTVKVPGYPVFGTIGWCDLNNVNISVRNGSRNIMFHGRNKGG